MYNVLVYDVTEGDKLAYRTYGNENASSVAMTAAWYTGEEIGLDTYLAPALFNGTQSLKCREANGTYQLTVPEGATKLAVTNLRYYATVY